MKTFLRSPGSQPCCFFQATSSHSEAFFLVFFEQWEPQKFCAALAQPGEGPGHLLRQSLNSTQVRPGQQIVGSFSHQGCCNQAAGLWLGKGFFSYCRLKDSKPISLCLPSLQPSITSLWTSHWQPSAVPCLSVHFPDLHVGVSPVIHTKFKQYTKAPIMEHLVSPWQTKATSVLLPLPVFWYIFQHQFHPVRKTAQQPPSKIKQAAGHWISPQNIKVLAVKSKHRFWGGWGHIWSGWSCLCYFKAITYPYVQWRAYCPLDSKY